MAATMSLSRRLCVPLWACAGVARIAVRVTAARAHVGSTQPTAAMLPAGVRFHCIGARRKDDNRNSNVVGRGVLIRGWMNQRRGLHIASRIVEPEPLPHTEHPIYHGADVAPPPPPLLVLHGVFGNSMNWMAQSRQIASMSRRTVHLLDMRNHGRSEHDDDMTVAAMVEDVARYRVEHGVADAPIALMGHSMGGKVAMRYALQYPTHLERLIVVDIAPVPYPVGMMGGTPMTDVIDYVLAEINLKTIASRQDADKILANVVNSASIRAFMLTNLERRPTGGYRWRCNLRAIRAHLGRMLAFVPRCDSDAAGHEVLAADCVHADGARICGERVLFIGGARSDYIQPQHHAAIEEHFPGAAVRMVADASHWVHADKPREFCSIVNAHLLKEL